MHSANFPKLPDVTLQKVALSTHPCPLTPAQPPHRTQPSARMCTQIGYQTDNGAYYCFCSGNCSQKLLDELAYLREAMLPMPASPPDP